MLKSYFYMVQYCGNFKNCKKLPQISDMTEKVKTVIEFHFPLPDFQSRPLTICTPYS